jgi:hypothetical protein
MHTETYLEVVNDALTIQEIVRNSEEVPIQGLTPGITPLVFREIFGLFMRKREQGGNFSVDDSLAGQNKNDHINMTHE